MPLEVWLQWFVFFLLIAISIPLLGTYLANVYSGQTKHANLLLGWLERLCYRCSGIDPAYEMNWKVYLKSLLSFNIIAFLFLFALLLLQGVLPLNPQQLPGLSLPLAFNIASSFVTNTNWQSYTPETTLSYLTQMLGLTVSNFLSASTGFTALIALIRGFTRIKSDVIGNFWVDLVRSMVYVLIPLSIILSIILISQGVVQSFSPYQEIVTLENTSQTIPLGPAASQIAIKQLGTNGGGFFNANSAHPFENPTPLSNLLESLALVVLPAAAVYAFGILVDAKKHAWLLLLAMFLMWGVGSIAAMYSQWGINESIGINPVLEGQETRFGISNSILWSSTTTSASNGSVNAMLSSLSPLSSGVAVYNIMIGTIFGGIGVGLCSMLMFVLLTIFIAGLMVGRTPEYLGKKIEKREIQWVMLAILLPGALILVGTGFSCVNTAALASLGNGGPHGFTEILYAFTSAAGNNGSSFAGLNANTDYYNIALGFTMLLGRISIILPTLMIAGLLAKKKHIPPSIGTFSTHSLLFVILLIAVIMIVAALTFFPPFSLGPIVEHLLMQDGKLF